MMGAVSRLCQHQRNRKGGSAIGMDSQQLNSVAIQFHERHADDARIDKMDVSAGQINQIMAGGEVLIH